MKKLVMMLAILAMSPLAAMAGEGCERRSEQLDQKRI